MGDLLLSAKEAAAELGVRVETLYSYVSRGVIRSEPGPGRARLYAAEDVRAFRQREHGRKGLDGRERGAEDLIQSSLTLITEEGPLYRGRLSTDLAQHGSFEAVATLLWGCREQDPFTRDAPRRPLASAPQQLRAVERAMVMLSAWPVVDRSAYAHHPKLLWQHGVDLCRLVAAELVNSAPTRLPIAEHMAQAWGIRAVEDRQLIGMALVLSADHELNSSAYAVRVAASTGAPLHAALVAGLGAFLGPRHGAASERVDHWLSQLDKVEAVEGLVEDRLMRAESLPGFGHFLYEGIDPRAACLLQAMERAHGDSTVLALAREVIECGERLFGSAPNIDFALAVLKRLLGLPSGAGMALFCAGRMAGWIGHALEQYESGQQIRPRARYNGPRGL